MCGGKTGVGACGFLLLIGVLHGGRAEGAGSGTIDLTLGAALRTVDETNTGAATALLYYRPRHKEIETESFVMSYEIGWGLDARVFNTLVDAQDAEFYRTSSLDLFGAYYVMKEKPSGQLVTSFVVRAALDEAEDTSGSLAVWTVKPEVWLELPFTDREDSLEIAARADRVNPAYTLLYSIPDFDPGVEKVRKRTLFIHIEKEVDIGHIDIRIENENLETPVFQCYCEVYRKECLSYAALAPGDRNYLCSLFRTAVGNQICLVFHGYLIVSLLL